MERLNWMLEQAHQLKFPREGLKSLPSMEGRLECMLKSLSTHLYLKFSIVGENPSATAKWVDIPCWVLWEEIFYCKELSKNVKNFPVQWSVQK